jgi:hypothetical protein
MPLYEDLFPKELLDKQLRSTGDIRGWKYDDLPELVKICRESGLAILGGKTAFFLPDGTCELYWKNAHPRLKTANESWQQYVERSGSEFLRLVKELYKQTDFENEGLHSYAFLRDKKKAGVNIMDNLCFEVEIMPEARYFQFYINLE